MDDAQLKTGAVIIVDHPVMRDRFALARIYGTPTAKRMRVQYWDGRSADWHHEHKARSLDCVVEHVADSTDLQRAHQQLQSAANEQQESEKRARQSHRARVSDIAANRL